MGHKSNHEQNKIITVYPEAAATGRGIAAVINAAGKAVPAGAGVMPNVIFNDDSAEGDTRAIGGTIPNGGITVVESGAPVSAGAGVTPDAEGKAVTAVTDDAIMGTALTSADAAGDFFSIQFFYRGQA